MIRDVLVPKPEDLGHDVWLIDLMEQGVCARTGAYLIRDEKLTLVETGASTSLAALLSGLSALGVSPADLSYIVVTHVHLDHAGGAGQLMALAPKATLVVHPRGARHMADPTRLWSGASMVYGERVHTLFGSIVPVPEERILTRDHMDTLPIGSRTLTFFDSPGHAKHHFTILDPMSDALFAGDALGIRYRSTFTGWDFEWVMPSSSPVDFDPVALGRTVDFLQSVPFSSVYHTHYGPSSKQEACESVMKYARGMADWISRMNASSTPDTNLPQRLLEWTLDQLRLIGHHPGPSADALDIDMFLNAMGLQVYYDRTHTTS